MSSLFSSPSIPKAEATLPPPKVEDTAVQQAAADALARRRRASGYRSTILSQGLMNPTSDAMKSTLGS